MLTESGEVLRLEGRFAWIACESRTGCARCAAGQGCGGALWGRLLGSRLHELRAACPGLALHPGDRVLVGLHPEALLRAATLAYLLPVLTLLAGALAGQAGWPEAGDAGAVCCAFAGLLAGLFAARRLARAARPRPGHQPVILQRLAARPCPPESRCA